MEFKKVSANLSPDVAKKLDDFIAANPDVSTTFAINQALTVFLSKEPTITFKLKKSKATAKDVDKFISDNSELMDDLAR